MGNPTYSEFAKAPVTTDPKFIQTALKTQNDLRSKHGSPPLTLNDELCKIAQSWANTIAGKSAMQHSTSGFGENIFWASSDVTDGKIPIDKWYSEIKDFNWKILDYQKGTGHFTQIIWKESSEFGIAKATAKNGSTYVVANYNPGGNMMGDYEDNVLPLKK